MNVKKVNRQRINQLLSPKIVDARVAQVFNTFKNVLVTSSFGTTSAVLLHIVNRIKPGYPVYFVDTRYHFEETLEYKKTLTDLLDLNVIDLKPDPSRNQTTRIRQMWLDNPDNCCKINKLEPLKRVKSSHSIWMSGLIGTQSSYRSNLEIIAEQTGMLRCYPLIDWNKERVDEYMDLYGLPRHPLEDRGYESVGCVHCTIPGKGRQGRWDGDDKTECGLHR